MLGSFRLIRTKAVLAERPFRQHTQLIRRGFASKKFAIQVEMRLCACMIILALLLYNESTYEYLSSHDPSCDAHRDGLHVHADRERCALHVAQAHTHTHTTKLSPHASRVHTCTFAESSTVLDALVLVASQSCRLMFVLNTTSTLH